MQTFRPKKADILREASVRVLKLAEDRSRMKNKLKLWNIINQTGIIVEKSATRRCG
ncbi:hypothetical protein Tcan_02864 [Toxocara canis]|uniref:Uncharacterized protein n=1 Tax=Toxocara canis TaxID=6265 RepID=A0A0B2VBR7_TOXCA|nr:hypothetical protein Tcan_02864 [Toxocara canis]